ncbi:MAG: hypothetical protein K2J00_02250 [Bacteroidaceae bacterium]|nr:hypothetical protein [Bacteroidaceae bacterium]
MKKLAFVFAAIVAVSFASCNNSNKTNGTTDECTDTTCIGVCEDSTACTVECDSCTNACCDSIACDSVSAE